jgi:hypothetical protein
MRGAPAARHDGATLTHGEWSCQTARRASTSDTQNFTRLGWNVACIAARVMAQFKLLLAVVGMSMFAGCAESTDETDDSGADQIDGKEDGSIVYPSGIYNNNSSQLVFGHLFNVTLSPDHTFSRMEETECVGTVSCGQLAGTYKFSHSDTTHYIRFLDQNGTLIDRYAFKTSSDGEKLSLRRVGQTSWFYLTNLDTRSLSQGAKCEDSKGNSLGTCKNPFACVASGPSPSAPMQCLPEI